MSTNNKKETKAQTKPQPEEDRLEEFNPAAAVPNPFDVDRFRLDQNFQEGLGVRKELLTVPVRKPDKAWWVRVRPGVDHQIQALFLELKEDRELFLIDSSLWEELSTESTCYPMTLFTAINRQNVLFLWPIRLPGQDGRTNEWNESAIQAADHATKDWTRVQANMSLGAYEVYTAAATFPEPEWPDKTIEDLLAIAFRRNVISSLDHEVLLRLRGEA